MKTLLIFLSILLCTVSLKSQIIENWTTPVALTDSTSNNSNPAIVLLDDNGSQAVIMFYEKGGLGSRQIWWKKISDPSAEEQMLIGGWPEVDYRNPQIRNNAHLIFECNVFGNYDIFGVAFDVNGLVGEAFQLTNTEYDENAFFCGNSYIDDCCWESEGNIIAAKLQLSQDTLKLAENEIVDSINCLGPVCRQNFIAWGKVENNESHIYYSKKSYPDYQWSDPDTITGTNDNTHLSLSRADSEWAEGHNLCWQAADKIYFVETWGGPSPPISSPQIPGIEEYFEPAGFHLIMLLDYFPELYAFAGQTATSRDIYIVDEFLSGYVLNITDDTLVDKNPGLFSGRYDWPYYEVINIWQTEINGYDVLYHSSAWYLATGGIEEDGLKELAVSPNPVGENQTLTIHPPENVLVEGVQVFSTTGVLIHEKTFAPQSQQFQIELKKGLPGVYFIKIETSRGGTIRKVIKL